MAAAREQSDTPPEYSFLIGGGEMSKLIRAKDWSLTPLGSIETWSPSLRTAVSIVMNSNFPISLAWGPNHIQIYNDGYWPICGDKHPESMGQDFSECWASAFPVIGDAFRSALAGKTAFLEDQRMFLDRLGYLEETFFTFSFSPIRDHTGTVVGLFHPVTETTGKMVSQRRAKLLRELTAIGLGAQSLDEAFVFAAQALSDNILDVPFSLFYRFDDGEHTARLAAQTGIDPGEAASPIEVDLTSAERGWPFSRVISEHTGITLDDVQVRFPELVCAPYPEPLTKARAFLIHPHSHTRPVGILIVGVSPRRPIDDVHETFFEMLSTTVNNIVASALAITEERRRAEALAEIDRAKTAFFSNISHEFRTPLSLIIGPLEDELAEDTNVLPEPRRQRLEAAHRNSLRLLKLVNNFLDFSLIEAGRAKANYQETDIAEATRDLASSFRSAVENAGMTLKVDCPSLPEHLFVDRDMWEKIILNLLSNAFKHTFEGGISVSQKWRGDHVEMSVTDTGVGIPAEELEHLFERFHRVEGARSRTHEGTGIGLALVKELIQLHGGSVRVQSEPGKGSTFTVELKSGREHLPADRIAVVSEKTDHASDIKSYVQEAMQWIGPAKVSNDRHQVAKGDRPTILWADDNADMRNYVSRLLSDHYNVISVSNGSEALDTALASPPDLILSDIMMPVLDGYGLLRELRANNQTRHIPVIFLSARAGEEESVGGLQQGADDYLIKPFSARELLARVRNHLDLAKLRREWAAEQERYKLLQKSEAALRESEREFKLLAESMPQIVWVTDREGRNIFFNHQWVEYTGLTLEESYGHGWNKPFHPDDKERAWDAWQNAIINNGSYSLECRILGADGVYRWWLVRGVPAYDETGQIYKWFGTCTDIEEIKLAEATIRAALQYSRSLIESSLDPLVTISADGKITDVNEATVKAIGLPREALIGSDFSNYFTDPEKARAGYQEVYAKGSVTDYPLAIRNSSGDVTNVLYNAALYRNENGEVAGAFAAARDVTKLRRAEEELRQHHEHLEELVKNRTTDLARANKQLESANDELESFAYSVSHDLRVPLRAIDGFSLILLEDYTDKLDPEGKRILKVIRDSTARISQLIDDILAFSRTGRVDMNLALIEMTPLVESVLADMKPTLANQSVKFDVKPLGTAEVDAAMIRRVWTNLIDNSVKFTSKNPEAVIEIGCNPGQDETIYYVKDNGVGFDMRYASKLFGLFQRLHGAEFPGTGVGLAIIKRVVTRHGGRAWAEGAEGVGATFYFALPKGKKHA